MERKRILVITDSPKLHTGFAGVGKKIWTYLKRTGKYDIGCIGWFHQDSNEEVIYPIFETEKDDKGAHKQEDKYAHKSLPKFIEKFKPDLVWTLGDMWMVDHVAQVPNRKSFKWVGYFPIDGHPSPSKWGATVENMDVAVAYGKYGMEVIRQRAPKANLKYIYHGVDSKVFHPISNMERTEIRKTLMGVISDDVKILGIVARNQPRKAFDKLFEAYFYILNGMYVRCNMCRKVTTFPFDIMKKELHPVEVCHYCGSKETRRGEARDDVRLYIHAAILDCGWDLLDLQKDFNLIGKILINPNLRIGAGVSEYTLNGIYNSFDIFTMPTIGEGFGLPILEAMSAGVPVVVTNYSAHTEWVGDGGILVPPIVLESEPMTNIRRAIIDMDLYVTALLELIDDPELRISYGKSAREIAKKMDWESVYSQWEELIDGVLFPDGQIPEKIAPSNIEYVMEAI